MSEIIEKHGGVIDKFIGDAIQAVFYQSDNISHSLCAVSAGLEMRRALSEFNKIRIEQDLFTIDNGIGIAAGNIVSGVVGSTTGRLDSAVIGEAAILSEELEKVSKYAIHTKVLIDDVTNDYVISKYNTVAFISDKMGVDVDVFEIIDSYEY